MKILFVCTANICRSALAEAILKKMLKEKGLTDIEVASAGVKNYEGNPRDETLVAIAHEAGYDIDGVAHYINDSLLDADLIICMEHYHLVEMQKRLPYVRWDCIHLFNEICFNERTDLIEPSGNTDYIYHYTFEKIQEGCELLSQRIEKKANERD